MFVDDMSDIRAHVIKFLHETLSGQLTSEKKFANEREFFSDQVALGKLKIEELNTKISKLEKELEHEKNYNLQLFVDEQVTQICQKAYFSFNVLDLETKVTNLKE